jgi:hypothetical protein
MESTIAIETQDQTVEVTVQDQKKRYTLHQLPDDFINWQIDERMRLFDSLKNKGPPSFFTPHLPTLLTIDTQNTEFLINATCKGIGLVPEEDQLEELTGRMQAVLQHCDPADFESSVSTRIQGAMLLYGSPEKIHRFSLGGLEIFENRSYTNIINNPFVSLFFVGARPHYKSFQLNCIAEIVPATDRFYSFLITMRKLFEEAPFHFQQPRYPYAIQYHVVEVLDKSLKVRGP